MTKTSAEQGGTDDFDLIIPQRVRALRVSLGLSAAELDRRCDFGTGTVGRMERGEQRIYAQHLYRLAQVIGVAVNYFYGDANVALPPHATSSQREGQRLLEAYVGIHDPALRHDVADLVKSIADEYANEDEGAQPHNKDE